ncbi:MAG: hypothetical protein ACFFF9_13715 [Candidatus Thorarchaeota archaeon]
MKILHTSHHGLPDHRVERAAYIAKKNGHTIEYLGLGETNAPTLDVFDSITMLRRLNNLQVALSRSIRKEWIKEIERINPDIIHANDLVAARFSSMSDYPMVYDDHEYWSKQRVSYRTWPLWRQFVILPYTIGIPRWEKNILSKHVTITVSEGIAEEHRRIAPRVFVLQNYCLREEVKDIPRNANRSGIAYVGSDLTTKGIVTVGPNHPVAKIHKPVPHRDMTGITDFIEFDAIHGLPRKELYQALSEYQFGLIPFKDNPFAKYSNSAKTFDYLNCGLQVLMTRSIYEAHGGLPYTYPIDDYTDIQTLVDQHKNVGPLEIMDYAHENLVWEAQQERLFEAYNLCLELFNKSSS